MKNDEPIKTFYYNGVDYTFDEIVAYLKDKKERITTLGKTVNRTNNNLPPITISCYGNDGGVVSCVSEVPNTVISVLVEEYQDLHSDVYWFVNNILKYLELEVL